MKSHQEPIEPVAEDLNEPDEYSRLSPRERSVIRQYFLHKPIREIANSNNVSESTVRRIVRSLNLREVRKKRIDPHAVRRIATQVIAELAEQDANEDSDDKCLADEHGRRYFDVALIGPVGPWVGPFGVIPSLGRNMAEVIDPTTGGLVIRQYLDPKPSE